MNGPMNLVDLATERSLPLAGRALQGVPPGVRIDEFTKRVLGYEDGLAALMPLRIPERAKVGVTFIGGDRPPCFQALNLREYQVEGVQHLLGITRQVGGALLCDDMGLGKTRSALAWALSLRRLNMHRVLIVCPASVRHQWAEEAVLALGSSRRDGIYIIPNVAVLDPTGNAKAKKAWTNDASLARIIITSFEGIKTALKEAFAVTIPLAVIIDEAHRMTNRKRRTISGKDSLAHQLEQAAKLTQYKLALTGTPIWSRPRNLWKLLSMLHGATRWGSSFDFDVRYCAGRQGDHGFDNSGVSNEEELRRRLEFYMVRRTKADVLKELPALTRTFRYVSPEPRAIAAFREALTAREPGDAQRALAATLEAKIPAAVEAMLEAKRSLCLTWTREHAAMIGELAQAQGLDVEVITGDLAPSARGAAIKAAIARGASIVATTDSVGTGMNLQGVASIGIMHALDYVPAKLLQAEARLHRMGQLEPVQWVYLVMKDTMDERVTDSLVKKLDTWRAVIPATEGDGSADLRADLQGQEKDALDAIFNELTGSNANE